MATKTYRLRIAREGHEFEAEGVERLFHCGHIEHLTGQYER